MKKPLPNDFYETNQERLANNGYWEKQYKITLKAYNLWKEKQTKTINHR